MNAPETTTYDAVPYESHPFAQSHPDRLATVATLLGMQPPALEKCRVLELGCAAGGNLLPMAASLPGSEFVGVDLSARQIADGQKLVQAAGLKNVSLRHASILDVKPDWGLFDYIVCHGVYSWVPPAVQDKILEISRKNLAPNGVAYVSYNTYPGWHMRSMIRRMMMYHSSHFTEPQQRVTQSRALLKFLSESVTGDKNPYSLLLKQELEHLGKCKDHYLFHEHLEEFNEPLYFHEFIERAQKKELKYLGEADLAVMLASNFKAEVRETLKRVGRDTIHLEQYMDFLRNRMFRQTLLCHAGTTLNYRVDAGLIAGFHLASRAKPASAKPDIESKNPEQFKGANGVALTSRDPLVKAAMLHMAESWPRPTAFAALVNAARERLGGADGSRDVAASARHLADCLLQLYASGSTPLLQLHRHAPQIPAGLSERPAASALARAQAERGAEVTSLYHERVTLDEFGRQVLRLLDGKNDRGALLEGIARLVAQNVLTVRQKGEVVSEPAAVRSHVKPMLERQLTVLYRNALVTA